jgi:hypothetical protein
MRVYHAAYFKVRLHFPPDGERMTKSLNERFLKAAGRHLVTLSCMQTPPGSSTEHPVFFSGFVILVEGVWFYVTAGHVLRCIRSAMDAGSKFDIWRLGDQTARGPFKEIGIPLAFSSEQWIELEDEAIGLDYAALPLRDLYRQALERGGVVPIPKDGWSDYVTEYDQWVLVGVPGETVTHDGKSVMTAKVVSVALIETDTPEGAGTRAENQFYAKLIDGSEAVVKNVEGMSGGPIFATKKVEDTIGYKVIGVQSAWHPTTRVIAACPLSSLGLALEKV